MGDERGLGGSTWIELFTLYDWCGYGNKNVHHPRKTAHTRRRNAGRKLKDGVRGNYATQAAQVAAPLQQETTTSKNKIRYITNRDLTKQQEELFKTEKGSGCGDSLT